MRVEEELALVRSAQGGNLEAFDRLVELHGPRLYGFARRMVGSAQEAEDLAQEAFVRAFKSLRQFRQEASFSTWLHRLALNLCLDHLKRKKRPPVSLETIAREDPAPSPEGNPVAAAERRERQEIIRGAIGTLPEAHRAVIVLYDLQGLSYEECAQVLKTSVGTVKSRLNRARLALKAKLEPQLELLLSG